MTTVEYHDNVSARYREAFDHLYSKSDTFRNGVNSYDRIEISMSDFYSRDKGAPAMSRAINDRQPGVTVDYGGWAVSINPKSGVLVDKRPASFVELMAHEIAHAIVAKSQPASWLDLDPRPGELAAVKIENDIRRDLGLPQRTDLTVETVVMLSSTWTSLRESAFRSRVLRLVMWTRLCQCQHLPFRTMPNEFSIDLT